MTRHLLKHWIVRALACACAAGAVASSGVLTAASQPVVIETDIGSITWLKPTACVANANATNFGIVLPGTPVTTASTCDVEFGSNSGTATLHATQTDGAGDAMFRLPDGRPAEGFGTEGMLATSPLTNVEAVITDAQGRMYVGGMRGSEMAVARYLANGSLDATWGVAGVREIPVPGAPINCADHVRGMEFDSQGRLVVVGEVNGWWWWGGGWACSDNTLFNHPQHAAIARLTSTGGIDTAFSGDGVDLVTGTFKGSGVGTRFEDLAVLDDDSVVAVGAHKSAGQGDIGLVRRYDSDGTVLVHRAFDIGDGTGAGDDWFTTVERQADGKVLAGGAYYHSGSMAMLPVVRRMDELTLADDASYGPSGQRSITVPVTGMLTDGVVLDSGSLLVLVTGAGTGSLTQLLPSGALDPALDGDGNVSFSDASGYHASLLVQEDGSVLVAGWTSASGGDNDWLLRRFRANGAIDTRFNGTGLRIYEPTAVDDRLRAVASGPDGLVVAGGSRNGHAPGAVLRLAQSTIGQYSSPAVDWDAGASMFGACLAGVTNGTPGWVSTGSCTDDDGDPWNPIGTDFLDAETKVASAASGVEDAVAHLVFGVRPAAAQIPGAYIAPITFTMVSPGL